MSLPQQDLDYLSSLDIEDYKVEVEGDMTCVVLHGWRLPPGFDRSTVDVLLRLSTGYPDVPPDMWWFSPRVHRSDGATLQATDTTETYLGREWQRWSRHLEAGQWKQGVDNLKSYVSMMRERLKSEGLQ